MDVTEYLRALEPPRLVVPGPFGIGKREYIGKILSQREFLKYAEAFSDVDEDTPLEQLEKPIKRYLKAIDIPWRVMRKLPPGLMWAVMQDFFRVQRKANSPMSLLTNGNGSPLRVVGAGSHGNTATASPSKTTNGGNSPMRRMGTLQ